MARQKELPTDPSITQRDLQTWKAYEEAVVDVSNTVQRKKFSQSGIHRFEPRVDYRLSQTEYLQIRDQVAIKLDAEDVEELKTELMRQMEAAGVSENAISKALWLFTHDENVRQQTYRYAVLGLAVISIPLLAGCFQAVGDGVQPTNTPDHSPTPLPTATLTPSVEAPTLVAILPSPTSTPLNTLVAEATQTDAMRRAALSTNIAQATQDHLGTREALLNRTPSATPTIRPTETVVPSATFLPTDTLRPATSIATLESTLRPDDTTVNLNAPGSLLVENDSGIDLVQFQERRSYLANRVDAQDTRTSADFEDAAFDAQWLGRSINTREDLNTDRFPNFFTWENGGEGRGWTSEAVLSHYLPDNDSFRNLDRTGRFWMDSETHLAGAAFVSQFEGIRQDLATLAVEMVLRVAPEGTFANAESLQAFLTQHNRQIWDLEDQWFAGLDIRPLVEGRGMRTPVRPTAWETYTKAATYQNYQLADSQVCITFMAPSAGGRTQQRENVVEVDMLRGLEARTTQNAETLFVGDLSGSTEVFLTFNTQTGRSIVDVTRVANIPDPLQPGHRPPMDVQQGVEGQGYFGRLVGCGTGGVPVRTSTGTIEVTPVHTIPGRTPEQTPTPETTSTPTATRETFTITPLPTNSPESTATRVPTDAPTSTNVFTPTNTPRTPETPVTPFPTPTEFVATRTPLPTNVPPTATVTRVPTEAPTSTYVPTPTETPKPPTEPPVLMPTPTEAEVEPTSIMGS